MRDGSRENFEDQVGNEGRRGEEVGKDDAQAGHHRGYRRVVKRPPGSKRGIHYVAAGNERIPNKGEITFDFESLEGHKESFVFQIAAVNKALGSVAYVVDQAFRVV